MEYKGYEVQPGKYIRHKSFDTWNDGLDHVLNESEANSTIEEIITLLISKKITVACAVSILEDTISSIQKEALLEKRKIGKEII